MTSPWAGFRIVSAFGWWLIPFGAIGSRLPRSGWAVVGSAASVVGIVAAGALVGAGIAFFALAFDTYVPRWTGLVRFGQYLPLLVGLGGDVRDRRLPARLVVAGRRTRAAASFAVVAAIAGLVWLTADRRSRATRRRRGSRRAGRRRSTSCADGPARRRRPVERADDRDGRVVHRVSRTRSRVASRSSRSRPSSRPTNALLLDVHDWFVNPTDAR